MRRPKVTAALVIAGLSLTLAACGGDDSEARAPATTATPDESAPPATAPTAPPTTGRVPDPAPPAPAVPLPGLPGDTAGFQDWDRLNGAPIPPDSPDSRGVGFDAHRSVKDVYVNVGRGSLTRADGSPRLPYPDGTIIVKEGSTDGTLTLIAIMRKITGVDPEHGDWEFVEYLRDSADEPFATSDRLRDGTCWGCHASVADDDWVFTGLDR
jgi:hypothetical protein